MAEDLTPPASGGVEPDPDQVLFAGPALVEHVAVKQRSYVVRFAVGYGLLGIVAGFAIAAFLLALGVSRPDPEPAWSGFVPQATVDRSAASVIADTTKWVSFQENFVSDSESPIAKYISGVNAAALWRRDARAQTATWHLSSTNRRRNRPD